MKQTFMEFKTRENFGRWRSVHYSTKPNTHKWACVQFTVVIFLLNQGHKVFMWVLNENISIHVSNIIKYMENRQYGSKNFKNFKKILKKYEKKFFFGSSRVRTGVLEITDPACYQKATETCWYKVGFLMLFNKAVYVEKISAHPTSQL